MMFSTLDRDVLENLVDRTSLIEVLEALSEIAGLKQEHVQANWQDSGLAKAWGQASFHVARAAAAVDPLKV